MEATTDSALMEGRPDAVRLLLLSVPVPGVREAEASPVLEPAVPVPPAPPLRLRWCPKEEMPAAIELLMLKLRLLALSSLPLL